MLRTSVKGLGESAQLPPVILPSTFRWRNYSEVVQTLPFLKFYQNTVLMTAGRTIGQLLFCSLAAYAFARIEFPGRNLLFILVLSVLMIPPQVFYLPQYLIMKDLAWLNSLQALILP